MGGTALACKEFWKAYESIDWIPSSSYEPVQSLSHHERPEKNMLAINNDFPQIDEKGIFKLTNIDCLLRHKEQQGKSPKRKTARALDILQIYCP
jgi:hypothetical protein